MAYSSKGELLVLAKTNNMLRAFDNPDSCLVVG